MKGLGTWWRRAGGVMAALVLTLLTFGPSFDALICQDEAPVQAVASAGAQTIAAAADHHDPALHSDGTSGVCAHGHCHHASPSILAAVLDSSEVPSPRPARHPFVRDTAKTGDRIFALIRPPRA